MWSWKKAQRGMCAPCCVWICLHDNFCLGKPRFAFTVVAEAPCHQKFVRHTSQHRQDGM